MELLIRSLPIKEHKKAERRVNTLAEKELKNLKPVLEAALKKFGKLQGFVLDYPQVLKEQERDGFYKLVGGQIASFGHAVCLPSLCVLVLLPDTMDSALVAHRLCANLQVSVSVFFEADNLFDILDLVRIF